MSISETVVPVGTTILVSAGVLLACARPCKSGCGGAVCAADVKAVSNIAIASRLIVATSDRRLAYHYDRRLPIYSGFTVVQLAAS